VRVIVVANQVVRTSDEASVAVNIQGGGIETEVSDKWVYDSITAGELLPTADFAL
jgi:uncharacterized protein YaiI (UPF0178 family)